MLTRNLLILSLCAAFSQANAVTFLLTGTNFDVQYDDATVGNFGTPSLSGNVVFFTPTNFKAESMNGTGFATASGTVNFLVIPKNDYVLTEVVLQERGDYILRGSSSFASVTGQTRAFSLQRPLVDIASPISTNSNLTFNTGLQQNWLAGSTLQLGALSLRPNQSINYTVENLLEAYTESNDSGPRRAFIEKKFVGFSVAGYSASVSPVPEPSTVLMMLSGLGLVGLVARKRTTQKFTATT
jgi:hypothetical protein